MRRCYSSHSIYKYRNIVENKGDGRRQNAEASRIALRKQSNREPMNLNFRTISDRKSQERLSELNKRTELSSAVRSNRLQRGLRRLRRKKRRKADEKKT